MRARSTLITGILAGFLLGVALLVLLVMNPGHWEWPERIVTALHGHDSGETASEAGQLWTCGMHPQVIQDHPGNCPICHMKLTPLKQQPPASATTNSSNAERKIKYWRAPMDANYISDKPGKSPMGMDLVPVYEDGAAASATGIRVDPGFLQNFAVRTAVAEKGSIPIEIRTVGVITYNEKNIASVNTKFEGWIEKAYVNYIGEPVKKGQVLFEIYSPQLVTTQQEYLAALDYVGRLEQQSPREAVDRARSLLEASHERLHYWDVSDEQIEQLKQAKKITRTLKIYSPASGVVVEKMDQALEGMKLSPGMNVFKIANLATVWAEIEVYEYQLQHVRLGQSTNITVDAFPGRTWTGKIIYLDPTLNQRTRTLKAFVEIPNTGMRLRPEMYANVELRTPAVSGAVKVPEEAVIHTGDRSMVIVQKEEGLFEPREVELGVIGAGYQEVRHGLQAGEVVVTSSQFLIDSESNLKEAINKMLAARSTAAAANAGPG